MNGQKFYLTLYFKEQTLISIEMMEDNPKYGQSWAELTEEKDLPRKAGHENWLSQTLEVPQPLLSMKMQLWNFAWGSIASYGVGSHFDPSTIKIKYENK